jgi:transposase
VLRAVQTQLDPEEAKALKKRRRRWLKSANQLNVDELIARYEWRKRFPQLREVIDWVQDLRMWFERKYEKPAREALLKLMARASQSPLEPLQRMAGTLRRWFEPITHYIRHRYSNGMTEGGIHVRRDRQISVRYSERANSSKRSFSLQRTERYGIVGQERSHFQFDL